MSNVITFKSKTSTAEESKELRGPSYRRMLRNMRLARSLFGLEDEFERVAEFIPKFFKSESICKDDKQVMSFLSITFVIYNAREASTDPKEVVWEPFDDETLRTPLTLWDWRRFLNHILDTEQRNCLPNIQIQVTLAIYLAKKLDPNKYSVHVTPYEDDRSNVLSIVDGEYDFKTWIENQYEWGSYLYVKSKDTGSGVYIHNS